MPAYSFVSTVPEISRSPVLSPVAAMKRYIESLPQEVTIWEEVTNSKFWKDIRTEFIATLLLTVLGCGSCFRRTVPSEKETSGSEVKVALAFGTSVAMLVQCLGPISGGHMNPAVSLSFLISRHISVLRASLYSVAQCLGSLAGAGILYGLTPVEGRNSAGLGATKPLEELHLSQAFGMEFLGTFVVVLVVLANTNRTEVEFGSFAIGTAYTVAHLFAFRYTGASLNPARSLGPAVITNTWNNHWVYWIGPLMGGIIGGFTYEYTRHNRTSSLKRSFRRKLPRDASEVLSGNETELTASFSKDINQHF